MLSGKDLRFMRESRGVKAVFVAEQMGVSKQQLSKIEAKPAANLGLSEFCAVANALGYKPGNLLPHDGEAPQSLRELEPVAAALADLDDASRRELISMLVDDARKLANLMRRIDPPSGSSEPSDPDDPSTPMFGALAAI